MSRPIPHLPFNTVAWTVGAFVLAAAPHLLAMPTTLTVVVLQACIWRLLAARRRWRPPPGWLRTALTLAAIALLAVSYGGLWGRRTATGLLCLMLAAKMLELYRIRDLRLVASVSLFLVATQFLFDERLVFIAYLFAGCLVALAALASIHRLETGQDGGADPDPRRILSEAGVLLLSALPLALALFMTFPRLAQPIWGLPDEVMDGRTGLSDSMSPGSVASLFSDDSPAFRAEFDGRPPPPEKRYWRGPVFWHFDGETWDRAFLPSRAPAADVPPGRNDLHYTVQLEPHERHWMFALDYPVTPPDEARISLDFQISTRSPVTSLTRYRMRSNPEFVDTPNLPLQLRRLALHLPEDRNPRTRALAGELRRRFDEDRELIAHVLGWLREEPFHYSLDTAPLGRHGADEFLFDLRNGYCEYYASAFAVLIRFAGIPARIVTGYQGGFWQEGGGYLLVRNSDAHAWVEVWLEGAGWVRVDPTAAVSPERIDSGAGSVVSGRGGLFEARWLRHLQNRYDRLQHFWNNWVLGFDAERQNRIMRSLGLPGITPAGMAAVMLVTLLPILLITAWNWLRPHPDRHDPVDREWRRLLARMRRLGLGKRSPETPLEWADRVAGGIDDGAGLRALVERYCVIRYSRHPGQQEWDRFIGQARVFRPGRREPLPAAGV